MCKHVKWIKNSIFNPNLSIPGTVLLVNNCVVSVQLCETFRERRHNGNYVVPTTIMSEV
jgi:hypothetical protein